MTEIWSLHLQGQEFHWKGTTARNIADVKEMVELNGSNVTFVMHAIMCSVLTLPSHLGGMSLRLVDRAQTLKRWMGPD